MSKHDFSLAEFNERRALVRGALEEAGLDSFIAFHPVSIHWLTGSDAKSYQEFQCLFIDRDRERIGMLTREGERAEFEQDALVDDLVTWGGREIEDPLPAFKKAAKLFGLPGKRVGIEVPAYYLHPHDFRRVKEFLGASLVAELTTLIHDLKLVKSSTELSYIRAAAAMADHAMEVFSSGLREGRTELALAGDVQQALLHAGSGIAASPINLVSGERSCFSHGAPTTRRLRRGDFGSIEFGATCNRYTSTLGRQFCLGPPTSRMMELYQVVRKAADACFAMIRAGAPASAPHLAAKRIIGQAGLEEGRVHTTGYGLGPGFPPTWGEPLHLLSNSTYTLQSGMVLTVEPPVFLGTEGLGARLIDNVVVTDSSCELLSKFPRDLVITP